MKDILQRALQKCEAAEVVVFDTYNDIYNVYNCRANDLVTQRHQEVCLRVIRDGRLGLSHGTYHGDTSALIEGALRSAEYGGEAAFAFASPGQGEGGEIFDPHLAQMSLDVICSDGDRIANYVKPRCPDMMLNLYMERERRKVSVVNSSGQDATYDQTLYTVCLLHMFPGSKEGINKEIVSCKYFEFPEATMDELVEDYQTVQDTAKVPSRPMPVIFRPSATWSLLWRLLVGVSGENVVHGVTPLADKAGQQIFSEKFTAVDDPTHAWYPGSVPFDDEGTPTCRKAIVDRGVLRSFIFDLHSGTAHGTGSTGNAFKRDMWGRGIAMSPTTRFTNLVISPGDMSYRDMLEDAGEAVVVTDVIGFHSGNMLKGEYSMNVGIGSYWKDGAFRGRVMDTMVSGNVYKDFLNIKALGDKVEYNAMAYSPAIYFEKLNVSSTG